MDRMVYFENSNGELISLDVVDCNNATDQVFTVVRRFCEDHHYKIPYMRMWNDQMHGIDMTCLDVGSHTEFFWVEPPLELTT